VPMVKITRSFSTKKNVKVTPITKMFAPIKPQFVGIRQFSEQAERPRKRWGGEREEKPLETNILLLRVPVGVDISSALSSFGVVENGVTTFDTGSSPYVFVEFASNEDATRAQRFIRSKGKNPSSDLASTSSTPSSLADIETLRKQTAKPSTTAIVPKVPYSFSEADFKEAFPGYKFTNVSVGHGKAYAQFATVEELEKFLQQSGVATIGKYPVNIYKSIGFDMDRHAKQPVNTVKIRGASAETTEEDIRSFLDGLNVTRVSSFTHEIPGGRLVTEFYAQFGDTASLESALGKDREKIGSRWVSVKRSSVKEIRRAITKKKEQEGSYGNDNADQN